MGVQDLVRLVLPKEDHFFDYLERQAQLAAEGVKLLHRFEQPVDLAEVKEQIHDIERQGDKVVLELEEALAKTFVTPIDREDLHRLSHLLDDILDRAYGCANAFEMYSVDTPSEDARRFFDILERASTLLAETMPCLRRRQYDSIRDCTRRLKQIEKEGDEVYRRAMHQLFASPGIEARMFIREKEVLEILESAVNACEGVSKFLANLAVKHG